MWGFFGEERERTREWERTYKEEKSENNENMKEEMQGRSEGCPSHLTLV
jgi:hypothetical protein